MTLYPASAENISLCADLLREGHPLAFPTETVYGLGADALNEAAVARIFEIKARPDFNPLIVHVKNLDMAGTLGVFPSKARLLAESFWPGPLTLVVPRREDCQVSLLASAGLPSLALRVPAHPVARQLLNMFDGPVAAPSANKSGQLSPTEAAHVVQNLPELAVLDGGACRMGLESTIVSCLDGEPVLLRIGSLDRAEIEKILACRLTLLPENDTRTPKLAPGRLARHYAPNASLRLNAQHVEDDEALLAFGPDLPPHGGLCLNLSAAGNVTEAAANLFGHLHRLDATARKIAVMPIPDTALGEAINDRLNRAVAGK